MLIKRKTNSTLKLNSVVKLKETFTFNLIKT